MRLGQETALLKYHEQVLCVLNLFILLSKVKCTLVSGVMRYFLGHAGKAAISSVVTVPDKLRIITDVRTKCDFKVVLVMFFQ